MGENSEWSRPVRAHPRAFQGRIIVSFKLLGAAALAAVMAVAAPMAAYAQDDQTIIMLGGPSSDPFWGAVQQGFNAAVAELG
eukprot:gene8053-10895_t